MMSHRMSSDKGMLRSLEPKSQNSDYGSFCNTPSETAFNKAAAKGNSGKVNKINNGEGDANPDQPVMDNPREPLISPNEDAAGGAAGASGSAADQTTELPRSDSCSSDDETGATNSSGYTRRRSKKPNSSNNNNNNSVAIDIPDNSNEETGPTLSDIPAEPLKTLIAFIWLFTAWVATTTSLALTHERVPEIDPLPDAFLDNVQYQPWGLDASEIIIMVATLGALALSLFHQHRFVILRRIFFLGGIHYFYRAVTMYITVLPKADPNYKCAPKLDELTVATVLRRVLKLLSGMGLSINGQHIYCGDYIYSGHTMTLLMTYLVIQEYSPKRFFLLRWLSFCTVVVGVLTLLFSRGHYSVDVVIAYWITTRLWWIYHTLANNPTLIAKENKHNYLNRFWWWYVFIYFEGNVGRPLPKGYNWPLPPMVKNKIRCWWEERQSRRSREQLHEEDGEV